MKTIITKSRALVKGAVSGVGTLLHRYFLPLLLPSITPITPLLGVVKPTEKSTP